MTGTHAGSGYPDDDGQPASAGMLARLWRVLRRIAYGFVDDDGFILAGYLAYLALLALFPFLLVLVRVANVFGESEHGADAIVAFLDTLPANVADVLRTPIAQVVFQSSDAARAGVVTLGIIIALWTAGSFIETVRVIIHRAYDHSSGRPVWQHRLQSLAMVIGSTLLVLLAMSVSLALSGVGRFVSDHLGAMPQQMSMLALSRYAIAPLILFVALYVLFAALTPRRQRGSVHWPGALVTVGVWQAATGWLPKLISRFGSYDVTYGSLAGIMVTLLFFYIVGLGLVLGAQLNAAIKWSKSACERGASRIETDGKRL